MVHIASPIARYMSSPEDKCALEIGHGGGRLLAAASRSFGQVFGVDIHDNNVVVEEELKRRGIMNFELFRVDGQTIPIDNNSIDLVYSFIVFQHVEKIDILKAYLNEAFRVLKPGGIAILYFGRKTIYSLNRNSSFLYQIDRIAEYFVLAKGYEELPARVNCTNLIVSLPYARKLARSAGFQVLSHLASRKNVPDRVTCYGGQNGLIIRKK